MKRLTSQECDILFSSRTPSRDIDALHSPKPVPLYSLGGDVFTTKRPECGECGFIVDANGNCGFCQ